MCLSLQRYTGIVGNYFLSFSLIFRDAGNGNKNAGGQMKRRKSGVTDDRGRANLTSFSSEERPRRSATP